MKKHFSGQKPLKIVITDLSGALLKIAEQEFKVKEAEYIQLNIRNPFPFENNSFDIIIATMVFNEIDDIGLKAGLNECNRVLKKNGQMIATITHPEFVNRLSKNGKLSRLGPGFWTMPGKGPLKIPVVIRTEKKYDKLLTKSGFIYTKESLYPSDKVINERPGLRHSRNLPLAMVFNCYKSEEKIQRELQKELKKLSSENQFASK